MNESLTVGPDGQAIGHYYEGLKTEAYPDPATGGDPWTCGIGCTGKDSQGNTIAQGTTWTEEKALHEYGHRMATEFGPSVKKAIHVEMNQKEFDAMVDLCYNIGGGNFGSSTLVKKFNAGDKPGAADQFLVWNKGGGKVMKGLERRRWAERHVFLGGEAADGIAQAQAKYP
jgi:lysozyme